MLHNNTSINVAWKEEFKDLDECSFSIKLIVEKKDAGKCSKNFEKFLKDLDNGNYFYLLLCNF